MSKLQDALVSYREKVDSLPAAEMTKTKKTMKITLKDLIDYQKLQSSAFAAGKISFTDANILYRIYGGESPSPEKWDKLPLHERVVGTISADQLIRMRLKNYKNPTYSQEMMQKFGVPFDPKNVTGAKGFKFRDRVRMESESESWQSGVPKGATGTVWAIKGIKGIGVSPDPAKLLIYVRWDKHGERSVWAGNIVKISDQKNPTMAPGEVICRSCGEVNNMTAISIGKKCIRCSRPLTRLKIRKKTNNKH